MPNGLQGRLPRRGDSEDLAAQRLRVLREAGVPGLARADVEVAIGTDGQPSAVVPATLGNATEDDAWLAEALSVQLIDTIRLSFSAV